MPELNWEDAEEFFAFNDEDRLRTREQWKSWSEDIAIALELIGYSATAAYSNADELRLGLNLRKTIAKEAKPWIEGLRKGTEIIKRLRATCEVSDIMAGVQAFDRMSKVRLDPKKIEDFVLKFRSLYATVKTSGYALNDLSVAHLLIKAATPVFPAWATIMAREYSTKQEATNGDVEDLLSSLQDEARRASYWEPQARKNPAPAAAGGSSKDSPSPDPAKDVYCLYCGKKGHFAKDCRSRAADMKRGGDGKWRFRMEKGTAVKIEAAQQTPEESRGRGRSRRARKKEEGSATHRPGQDDEYAGTFAVSALDRSWFADYSSRHIAKASQDPQRRANRDTNSGPKTWWLFDTGADIHATNDGGDFVRSVALPPNAPVISTGAGPIRPTAIGDVELTLNYEGDPRKILLTNVLLIKQFPVKIFSGEIFLLQGGILRKHTLVTRSGCEIAKLDLKESGLFLHEYGRPKPIKHGHIKGDTFTLSALPLSPGASEDSHVTLPASTPLDDSTRTRLWHRRLGHPGKDALKKTLRLVRGTGMQPSQVRDRPCDTCDLTKSLCYRSQRHFPRATKILEVVHMDSFVIKPTTIDGFTVGVYLIDDCSRYRDVVFARKKEQLADKVIEALKRWETLTGFPLVTLHCDQGREFLKVFSWAKERGTTVVDSAPYTPEENPISERTVAIVNTKTSAMIRQGEIPQYLAGHVISHAVNITNCTATTAVKGKTPHERFHDDFKSGDNRPDLSMLRTVGCKVFVNITRHPQHSDLGKRQGHKWDPRAVLGKLVGWEMNSHNYFVYIPGTRKVIKSPHVVFHEDYSDSGDDADQVLRSQPPWVDDIRGKSRPADPTSDVTPVYEITDSDDENRQQAAQRAELGPGGDNCGAIDPASAPVASVPDASLATVEPEFVPDWQVYATVTATDPKTYKEAMNSPFGSDWQVAIDAEVQQLLDFRTLEFVDAAVAKQACSLTAKWVFKEKRDPATGTVYRRKARIVARGFLQREGIDYTETFATTAAATSVRVVLALAALHSLALASGDVVGAYLVGEPLQELIYMRQFEGLQSFFERHPEQAARHAWTPTSLIRLLKPLYGLKQAGRNWQLRLKKEMATLGLMPTASDDAVYVNTARTLIVLSHVDDLYVAGRSEEHCGQFFGSLGQLLEVDTGDAQSYLGMRIRRDVEGAITIDQAAHIAGMLGDLPMRKVSTPVSPSAMVEAQSNPGKATAEETLAYQTTIGQIIYPTTRTRPDVAFAASLWARFMSNPTPAHAREVSRVLRYFSKYPSKALRYHRTPAGGALVGYADAAYDNQEGSKSTSGWVFMLAGGPVSWSSKRQSVVAHSSTEAEYYALGGAAREAAWLRELLDEMGYPHEGPIKIREDNTSCIRTANNTVSSTATRMKHVRRCQHYVRDEVEAGRIELEWVPGNEQAADGFTKPLEKTAFEQFVDMLGMVDTEAEA